MLVGAWKRTGKIPPQLADHPVEPERLAYIWRWYNELPSPVTWQEIHAWAQFSRFQVERWEGVLLIRIDSIMRT
jgi:hypothetical protein